jgi:group II intron reverse transcriptase/maturase
MKSKKGKNPAQVLLESSWSNETLNDKTETLGKVNVINKLQKLTIEKIKKGQPLPKYDNLIQLVACPYVLEYAYSKLRSSHGATTKQPGRPQGQGIKPDPEKDDIEGISVDRLKELAKSIKDGNYIPKPVHQVWIPKPGKTTKRPLGIPSFKDKLVQEAIRMVLNAIYDPQFEAINSNHGFRPNKSPHSVIHKIKGEIQGLTHAIEGDIDSAYPSLDHEILQQILEKSIRCKKFLNLIWKFCKAGIFDLDKAKYENTLLGVPQGQIASPILFNIYMHEFDKYIQEDIQDKHIQTINEKRPTKTFTRPGRITPQNTQSSRYRASMHQVTKFRKKLQTQRTQINLPITEWTKDALATRKYNLALLKSAQLKRETIPTIEKHQATARTAYYRYADDWILFTNLKNEDNEIIKNKISEWFTTHLKFKLSKEKTKITDLEKDAALFLGFSIKQTDRKRGNKKSIIPDWNRLIFRLHLKNFCDKSGYPRERPALSTLKEDSIIENSNSTLLGLLQYYYPVIDSPSQLQRLAYIIYYSCLKTLTQKAKGTTLRKLIKKIGGIKNSNFLITKDETIIKSLPIYNYPNILEKIPSLNTRRDLFQNQKTEASELYMAQLNEDILPRFPSTGKRGKIYFKETVSFAQHQTQ